MKDDFEIIKRTVPAAKKVKLYPVADVHFGSIMCDERAWMNFRDRIAKEENAYVVLLGDQINFNTRSSVGSPFEDIVRPRDQKRIMAEMLKPLADAGKIVAGVSGNHEKRGLKDSDDDPMYDILAKLDLEDIYRENIAFIQFGIGQKMHRDEKNPRATVSYNIAITHGSGGGALTGGSVNKVERFGFTLENVDALITGHTHKGSVTKPARLCFYPGYDRVYVKPFVCVQATPWLKYGGYAVQKMLSPADVASNGGQVLELGGTLRDKKITVVW